MRDFNRCQTDDPGWLRRQVDAATHSYRSALITSACMPFFNHEDCERGDSGCECACHERAKEGGDGR